MTGRISNIANRMNNDCEQIAVHLFGHPAQRLSNKREWRWGEHGRFRLHVAGPKRGKWNDFSAGDHGDMLDLIGRELGLDKRDSVDRALDWLGGDIGDYPKCPDTGTSAAAATTAPDEDRQQRQARALAVWNEAVPILSTLSERYLTAERGLHIPDDILAGDAFRHHPALYHDGAHMPGLVALMRDPATAEPVGIQRTFLTPDGRKIERRMRGSAGVVMLSPNKDVTYGLGLAEGLETGLAVMTITGWRPVWAVMSAGAIRTFPVLSKVETITIFADADAAGHSAAVECGRRLSREGVEVRVLAPPQSGYDWDDWLLRRRVA